METRFIFPTTLAAAVHTFVLFGITWPPPPPAVVAREPKSSIEICQFHLSDPPEPPPEDQSQAKTYGTPDAPPTLPEPPAMPTDCVISIPADPAANQPPSIHWALSPLPPGDTSAIGLPGPHIHVEPFDHLDSPPRTRYRASPVYPGEMKAERIEGEVLVEFMVDEAGRVHSPRVVRSSDPAFESNTLRAVSNWRFEPGRKNGQIVRFRMQLPVAFKLE